MKDLPMLTYDVSAKRVDSHGSLAQAKQAEIMLGTDMAGGLMRSIRRNCFWRRLPLA